MGVRRASPLHKAGHGYIDNGLIYYNVKKLYEEKKKKKKKKKKIKKKKKKKKKSKIKIKIRESQFMDAYHNINIVNAYYSAVV